MCNGVYNLITPPTAEVLSLSEVKNYLQIYSYSLSEGLTPVSTISPGSHIAGSITGDAVDCLGYNVYFECDSRTNGTGGTVTLIIKESNDNVTFNTWSISTFAVITTSNDNQFFKVDYTGTKRYLRVDAVVANAACEFGVNIVKQAPVSSDDAFLTSLIRQVRETAEKYQNRAFLPQTWTLTLDDWPDEDYIKINKYPLASVTSIKYKDTAGTEYTFAASNYIVNTAKKPGLINLAYSCYWPTEILLPTGAITITFIAGYADLATLNNNMHANNKQWMLAAIKYLYFNRESQLEPDSFAFKALGFDRIGGWIG